MKIVPLSANMSKTTIAQAVSVLTAGGLIIYPTETCYGVGVDAINQKAVDKLLAYKDRPEGKAISIAVANKEMAEKYVELNKTARNLYNNFLPGPLTVISRSKHVVAKGLEAEDGSLGVRIPDFSLMIQIIKQFGKPITATSANVSGRKTPYAVADVLSYTIEKKKRLIDLIIDAGELPHNPPSTVVDTRMNDEKIVREGSISLDTTPHRSYKTYMTYSENETQQIGQNLMQKLLPELKNHCVIFALQGDLGAGKTQFAKGVAKVLGIKETVTSPTFVLVKEYKFKLRITNYELRVMYHIDTWRMREGDELLDLGFETMVKPGNVIVIEWVEKVKEILDQVAKQSDVQVEWIVIEGRDEIREIKKLGN